VSFVLELDVSDLTPEQGRAIEEACQARQAWPLAFVAARSRKRLLRSREASPAVLEIPEEVEGRHLLSDAAEWDAPAWDFERNVRPRLAETLRILGEHLSQGFVFRASWIDGEVRDERTLTAEALAQLAADAALNEFTRYVVAPDPTRMRSFYFAHPAVGIVPSPNGWPSARSAAALGARWADLNDEQQTAEEEAFFRALFVEIADLWPSAVYRAEYPYGDGPRKLLATGATPSDGGGQAIEGRLSPNSIDVLVTCAPQPVILELLVDGQTRLLAEPWEGVGLYLLQDEHRQLSAAAPPSTTT
jgi:hypothetical protein